MYDALEMVWLKVMRAAFVDPVGLYVNWSAKCDPCGGCLSAG